MGVTAWDGPLITFGKGSFGDQNPADSPSAWHHGDMLLDPRTAWTYQPGQAADQPTYGWLSTGLLQVLDCVPSTLSASNIASATPVPGTALTLASASVTGVTVGCSIINAATGLAVTGLLGLDVSTSRTVTGTFTNGSPVITFTGVTMLGVQVGDQVTLTSSGTLPAPFALLTTYYVQAIGATQMMLTTNPSGVSGTPITATTAGSGTQTINVTATQGYYVGAQPCSPPVAWGQGGSGFGGGRGGLMRAWNPAWNLSRCVTVTANGTDTSGFYTIRGYDIYGYPMTQTLTGTASSVATSTKAFKYIASVTPTGTINSTTLTVGTADLFGLPLRTDWPEYLVGWFNSATVLFGTTASTTFNAADISVATALTGDVRGTVYGGAASDGTKRLYVAWVPQVANMNSSVGYIGATQF